MTKLERLAEIKNKEKLTLEELVDERSWLIETLEREMERSSKLRDAIWSAKESCQNNMIVKTERLLKEALEAFNKGAVD